CYAPEILFLWLPFLPFHSDCRSKSNCNIIKDCIDGVLDKADYNHWTAAIVEQFLSYFKCGAGLHTANSCFWDTTTDGSCPVRWENRTMNCVVNVFAVPILL
uniref:Dynein light chain Tctex-type 3 n=1 Tax=Anolis carolinensis TaxID=28377 RepID=A0A803SU53_ANOCA